MPGRFGLTPYVKLLLMAKSALLFDAMNPPPASMNCRRCSSPSRPMPMRVSSVCAQVPMFGVSAVFWYGIAVCHSGVPSTAPWLPPGRFGLVDDTDNSHLGSLNWTAGGAATFILDGED